MVIAFAGGAKGVQPLVAMMVPQRFEIVVVLDSDEAGRSAGKRLEDSKFTDLPNVELGYYGNILGQKDPFDLESILPPDLYLKSIEEAHQVKLPKLKPGKKETLSVAAKRSFGDKDIEFDKGVAMQWLVDYWREGEDIPDTVLDHFEKVFQFVQGAIDGMIKKQDKEEKVVEPAPSDTSKPK